MRAALAAVLEELRLHVGEPDTDLSTLEDTFRDAESELGAFSVDLPLRKALGEGDYAAARDARIAAVDAAQTAYDAAARSTVPALVLDVSTLDAAADLEGVARSVTVAQGRGDVSGRVTITPL